MTAIVLVHAAATWAMTGLIWFIQIVHYPLFGSVGEGDFVRYEAAHARLTTYVVGPLMLVEALTAIVLVWRRPDGVAPAIVWAGLALVGVLWASTAWIQVPQHSILANGFDAEAHRRLVTSNWLRTVAWTMRTGLVAWMLLALLRR